MYQASYGVPDPSAATAPGDGEAPEASDSDKGDRVGAGNQGDGDSGSTDKEDVRAANGASQVSDGWWAVNEGQSVVGSFR